MSPSALGQAQPHHPEPTAGGRRADERARRGHRTAHDARPRPWRRQAPAVNDQTGRRGSQNTAGHWGGADSAIARAGERVGSGAIALLLSDHRSAIFASQLGTNAHVHGCVIESDSVTYA